MQPATLKLYVNHAVLKCDNGTDVMLLRDFACRLNSPPSCDLEFLYTVYTTHLYHHRVDSFSVSCAVLRCPTDWMSQGGLHQHWLLEFCCLH